MSYKTLNHVKSISIYTWYHHIYTHMKDFPAGCSPSRGRGSGMAPQSSYKILNCVYPSLQMNQLSMFILVFFLLFLHVEAQAPHDLNQVRANPPSIASAFRPSLAVIVGILSIMFLLTFLLLVYAKFCHSSRMNRAAADMLQDQHNHGLAGSVPRFSGIDKTVIESLPFFRFSALKGSKEGLECSVCLSKFEQSEILRLLPKCKHAFHINCIDHWLESHSSCPLCRCKVDAEDLAIFAYSNSLRFSWNHSQLIEDPNLELFVEREQDNHGSSRFSIGGSFRKILEMGKKEELPTRKVSDPNDDGKLLHKFKHKIIVSDVVFKSRWSDLTSADVMFLNSEMFNLVSSRRFSSMESNSGRFGGNDFETGSSKNDEIMKIKEEMEMKRSFESKVSAINKNRSFTISSLPSSSSDSGENLIRNSRILSPEDKRSKSEITKVSRFPDLGVKNRVSSTGCSSVGNNAKEERMRKLWFQLARRTVQWFAGRERRLGESQCSRQPSNL